MPAKKPRVTLEQFFDRFAAFENRVALRFDQVDQNFKGEIARLGERIRNIDTNLEKLTGDVKTLTQEYHAIVAGLKDFLRMDPGANHAAPCLSNGVDRPHSLRRGMLSN